MTSMSFYQTVVSSWLDECFGEDLACNRKERAMRFLEEALELVQVIGLTKDESSRVLDYVYNRDIGELEQEVGGVSVTLAALCAKLDVSLEKCAMTELRRIDTPENIKKIRAKQDFKKTQGMTSDSI